jgi:hypothetical protein
MLDIENRLAKADTEFAMYDFGDSIQVVDDGPWDTSDVQDFVKSVFVKSVFVTSRHVTSRHVTSRHAILVTMGQAKEFLFTSSSMRKAP